MESLSQTGAELGPRPPPPAPGPTEEQKVKEHLKKTLPELRNMTDSLLQRYQETGIKWHLIPFAARASLHLDSDMIDMLDEVFSINDEDGMLAVCVSEKFSRLVSFLVDGQRALERGGKHLGAALVCTDAAEYEANKLAEIMNTSEAAVADVIAIRNSLDELDMLPGPEVWLTTKLVCFEDWLDALKEAEADWIKMKS